MPAVNLRQPQGSPRTSLADLVRAIRRIYDAVAPREGEPGPTLQYGARYVEQINAPPRIVFVKGEGNAGPPIEMGAGQVGSVSLYLDAHIWGPEPTTLGDDEMENELAREDAVDPMLDRYLNVLSRVVPGRVDPDNVQINPPGAMLHGEQYVVRYTYMRHVPRDARVFAVLPATDPTTGQPVPPPYTPPGRIDSGTLDITTIPQE